MENYLIPKIKEAKEVETNRHRKIINMQATNHKLIQMKTQQEEQIGLANLWIAVNKYRIKNKN